MLERTPKPDGQAERRREQRREQQRRHRARQRKARRAYLVEMGGAVIDLLIRHEALDPAEAGDDQAVGRAAAMLLAVSAQK